MRERLDNHPRALRIERFIDMFRRAHGIPHVVQAIEKRHQIVAGARVVRGGRDFEPDSVAESRLPPLARAPVSIEPGVIIETHELELG